MGFQRVLQFWEQHSCAQVNDGNCTSCGLSVASRRPTKEISGVRGLVEGLELKRDMP